MILDADLLAKILYGFARNRPDHKIFLSGGEICMLGVQMQDERFIEAFENGDDVRLSELLAELLPETLKILRQYGKQLPALLNFTIGVRADEPVMQLEDISGETSAQAPPLSLSIEEFLKKLEKNFEFGKPGNGEQGNNH